jgi:hypothetical protein
MLAEFLYIKPERIPLATLTPAGLDADISGLCEPLEVSDMHTTSQTTGAASEYLPPDDPERDELLGLVRLGLKFQAQHTGRPRSCCFSGCRRAAEKEISRLNDRLQNLEARQMEARLGCGMFNARDLANLEAETERAEPSLSALLDAYHE